MAEGERFLITGALGCIGAWTARNLLRQGARVVVFDLAGQPRRLRLVLSDEELRAVTFVDGDITDLPSIERGLDDHGITHVIHLAGLQMPFCKADPPLGARVNVVGTVNVFEAVKRRKDRIVTVAYASSMAVFGTPEDYPDGRALTDGDPLIPHTHYGVYKLANEGTAHVYFLEDGVSSVGLRPYVVYGVGRDQGLTSTPTTAMLAAAAGLPYRISYGGKTVFQYADDTARAFIQAARSGYRGASAFNLGGPMPEMAEVIDAIAAAAPDSAGLVTFVERRLPYPPEADGRGLEAAIGPLSHRPLAEAVGETVAMFRDLVRNGRIDAEQYVRERTT